MWRERPEFIQPIMIVAFEGWNDAGDAASDAVRFLIEQWNARSFASIEAESFFDFTTHRPTVHLGADGERRIDWPENTFWKATPPGAPDVILLSGTEPHLRWRTFCDHVLEVAATTQTRLVLTLGSLLADVPHSRPASVFGTAHDPKVMEALGLERSRYEGPTGIVGVLHDECAGAGINSASLWAAVPSYVAAVPSPKAQHALVHRVCEMLRTEVDDSGLQAEALAYERQISGLVAEDDETVAYVRHLEEVHDREASATGGVDALVDELERFLREQ